MLGQACAPNGNSLMTMAEAMGRAVHLLREDRRVQQRMMRAFNNRHED